jgi:hypothetical protein
MAGTVENAWMSLQVSVNSDLHEHAGKAKTEQRRLKLSGRQIAVNNLNAGLPGDFSSEIAKGEGRIAGQLIGLVLVSGLGENGDGGTCVVGTGC